MTLILCIFFLSTTGGSIFNFLRNPILFSIMTVPVYIPINSVYVFPFLCIQNLSFENSYSNRWKLHLIVVFGLYFSNVAFFNVRLLL